MFGNRSTVFACRTSAAFSFHSFLWAPVRTPVVARKGIKMGKDDTETAALKKELEDLINKCKVSNVLS